jgi:hypothetical protein
MENVCSVGSRGGRRLQCVGRMLKAGRGGVLVGANSSVGSMGVRDGLAASWPYTSDALGAMDAMALVAATRA